MAGLRVGRRRFQPTLAATLVALPALLVLLGLGVWQLQRLAWKESLIAERTAALAAPAVELPANAEARGDLEFHIVRVSGRFLHDHELHVGSKTWKGRVGFHIVTPFELTDGRVVLVDRGWVPPALRASAARKADRPEGLLSLEAILRGAGWKGSSWFQPENDPAANYWLWIDSAAMLAQAGVSPDRAITGFYLQLVGPSEDGGYPARPAPVVELRNDHLQYAVTWFALAGVFLVIYLLFHLRPIDAED